jgi:hypothetical protein
MHNLALGLMTMGVVITLIWIALLLWMSGRIVGFW